MADMNDYIDQYAEQSTTTKRDPRSFMTVAFQQGAEHFIRGGKWDDAKSEEWKDGWSFAMKSIFIRNTRRYVFGDLK